MCLIGGIILVMSTPTSRETFDAFDAWFDDTHKKEFEEIELDDEE